MPPRKMPPTRPIRCKKQGMRRATSRQHIITREIVLLIMKLCRRRPLRLNKPWIMRITK